MNLSEYQETIPKLASIPKDVPVLFYCAACACEEAGEVLDVTMQLLQRDMVMDVHPDLIKELGDVLWYLTMAANDADISIEELLEEFDADDCVTEWPGYFAGFSHFFHATQLCLKTADVMGIVKKHFRDRKVEEFRELNIYGLRVTLAKALHTLAFVGRLIHVEPEEIAHANHLKIVDRVTRGTFHGAGSHR